MEAMAELPPGSVLAGCRIEAVVGRGGMGIVYRATQLSLDRPVALKVIAPQLADDVTFRERFKRESRIAASIEHPNVIPVYEAGEGEGVLYLIMRYVEGTDLRAVIDAARGGLEPGRATRLVAQVAAALAAAHRRGLIHRDVKPANVLIDAAGDVEHAYLTDFGIARHSAATSGLTHTGAVIGTVDYLAPERIQGQGGDGRADLYALGCVLFEALTGTQPFERDHDVAKMYAHLSAPVPSIRERRPDVPAELDELARTAMAKEPDARFASAAEMAEALTETLPSRPRTWGIPAAGVTPPGGPPTERAPAEAPPGAPPAPTERAPAEAPPTEHAPADGADLGPTRPAAPAGIPGPQPAPPIVSAPPAERPPDAAAAAAPPRRPPPRRRPSVAAIGVVLAALVGAALVLVLASGGGGDDGGGGDQAADRTTEARTTETQATETQATDTSAALAFGEAETFDIPSGSDGMGVGEGAVWIANKATDQVLPVEEDSGEAGDPIPVGDEPDSVAVGFGAVWVTNSKGNTVSRIDPLSRIVTEEIETGQGPEGIAVTDDDVWVANGRGDSVTRISPDDLSTSTTPVGAGPVQLAVTDDGGLWVTLSEENRVVELDPDSGEPTGNGADVPGQPRGIAFGAGKLWVSALQRATLARFDPQNPGKVDEIRVPAGPREVRFGLDAIWVNSSTEGRLTAIDPRTRKRVAGYSVGKENYGLAVSDSFAWSSSLRAARLTRVAPE
jgi:YVTN family beta-propeller protein